MPCKIVENQHVWVKLNEKQRLTWFRITSAKQTYDFIFQLELKD